MNKAKRKYAHECKQKVVTFYKKDKKLFDFANSINFQGEVKQWLKRLKTYIEKHGTRGAK